MHNVRPGIWRETRKIWKRRQKHCLIWNIARNTENGEKCEIHTVGPGVCLEN
jgi:hypothetical protein